MTHEHTSTESKVTPISDGTVLLIIAFYAVTFIVFGFVVSPPSEILDGLIEILTVRDTLITDYIGVGGMGAAFVNAGLLTLAACGIYHMTRAQMSGASVACLFFVLGFGLFGKNLLNVWLIVAGVFLYARFKNEPFASHVNVAFFGCALAPVVSEILFSTTIPLTISVPLAVLTGLILGFVLPPAAKQLFKAHMGFSLYNIGFTAGFVGVLVVALYKSYGLVAEPVMIWTSGNNSELAAFLVFLFASMILAGFYFDRRALSKMPVIAKSSGQVPTDFVSKPGLGPTLLNMGLSGAIGLAYVLLIGSDLNGPTIGGIFAIVGFAAFGARPGNFVPIMIGVFIGALAKPWEASDEAIVLAALFGTALAPIAGRFGWHWGIIAGFVHSSAVLTVGASHAGLNLYNNGFSAGMVAAVLVPVIIAVTSRRTSVGPG